VAVEGRTTDLSILSAIREALVLEMESDERGVVVLGKDVGMPGGVVRDLPTG
jgi:pyruvate/2-oxoglutarate/acetoin dehydrogenase E1 component